MPVINRFNKNPNSPSSETSAPRRDEPSVHWATDTPTITVQLPRKTKFDMGVTPALSRRPDGRIMEGPAPESLGGKIKLGIATRVGSSVRNIIPGVKNALDNFKTTGYHMQGIPAGMTPHTDSHMHPSNYVQNGLPLRRLTNEEKLENKMLSVIELMDKIGVRNTTLMPIPTSLISVPYGNITRQVVNIEALKNDLELALDKNKTLRDRADAQINRIANTLTNMQNYCGDMCSHNGSKLEYYYVPQGAIDEVNNKAIETEEKDGEWNDKDIKVTSLTIAHLAKYSESQGAKALHNLIDKIIQSGEIYVDTGVNHSLSHLVQNSNLNKADRSRFDPMITGLNLADPRMGDKFLRTLGENKGVFTGSGEITIHKELIDNLLPGKTPQLGVHAEPIIDFLEKSGIVGAPVVIHCDVDSLANQIAHFPGIPDIPTYGQQLKELFSDPRVSDTKIVWAHAGGLGRFIQERQENGAHIEDMKNMLRDIPNLHLDVSWTVVAEQLTKSEEHAQKWADFLNDKEFQGRLLFGSDTLAPRTEDAWKATYTAYDKKVGLFERLTPEAKHSLLNGAYEKVFVESRKDVRKFEDKVLTPKFMEDHFFLTKDIKPNEQQRINATELRELRDKVYAETEPRRPASLGVSDQVPNRPLSVHFGEMV